MSERDTPTTERIAIPPPPPRPSAAPPPLAVQIIDKLGEIAGAAFIFALAWSGKLSGEFAAVTIGAFLGLTTGLGALGRRLQGTGPAALVLVGTLGLALSVAGCGGARESAPPPRLVGPWLYASDDDGKCAAFRLRWHGAQLTNRTCLAVDGDGGADGRDAGARE